jgi:hypothetical protein
LPEELFLFLLKLRWELDLTFSLLTAFVMLPLLEIGLKLVVEGLFWLTMMVVPFKWEGEQVA